MNKKILIFLIIVPLILLLFVGCENEETEDVEAIWKDFVKIDGVTYSSDLSYNGREIEDTDVVEEYARITSCLSNTDPEEVEVIDNGCASYLPVNTKMFTFTDYLPTFRIVTKVDGNWVMYEAIKILNATKANEYYDIEDKVEYIEINSQEAPDVSWVTIDDTEKVEDLVDKILVCDVDTRKGIGNSYYIVFYLKDGTSVTRKYWHDLGILYPGIQITEDITAIIQKEIENN